jgi:hypothetical protein
MEKMLKHNQIKQKVIIFGVLLPRVLVSLVLVRVV